MDNRDSKDLDQKSCATAVLTKSCFEGFDSHHLYRHSRNRFRDRLSIFRVLPAVPILPGEPNVRQLEPDWRMAQTD